MTVTTAKISAELQDGWKKYPETIGNDEKQLRQILIFV